MKIRKIHIRDYKIFQDFDIDFTHQNQALPLVVLIGINGSGKTTLLRDIIYLMFDVDSLKMGSHIEYEYSPKEIRNLEYPFLIDNSLALRDEYYEKHNNSIYYFSANQSDTSDTEKLVLSLIDKLIYEKDFKSSEAYLEVQRLLKDIFKDFDLQVVFGGADGKRRIYFSNAQNSKIGINELSSGEQEIISKAFELYLSDIKNSIILIDEPESSLHPNWQMLITQIYQRFAEANDNQIILATHSPHIVGAVRKEQIRILTKKENKAQLINHIEGSYGWRADKILLEIFGINHLRTPTVEKKLEVLQNLLDNNDYQSDNFLTLQKELENLIGYTDRDLTLIRLEKARKLANEKN